MMKFYKILGLFFVSQFFLACKDYFPEDKNAFSLEMNFTSEEFFPYTGRNNVYSNIFNAGNSTQPLSFRISSVRAYDGEAAPELQKPLPVKIWKSLYTGTEKSIEEIEAKRELSNRPILEIGEHSGEIIFWNSATDDNVKVDPDSGYVFDVEVTSTGGRKFFRDMVLRPQRAEPYDPYLANGNIFVTSIDILGDSTLRLLEAGDVKVWLNRRGAGNSLTFKFLNPDLSPIDTRKFNDTDWDNLVHGFNKRVSDDYSSVTYDVSYPIPLVRTIPTKYTNTSGSHAHVEFAFNRVTGANAQNRHAMTLDFAIFEEGEWDVIFYFQNEAPSFINK